MRKKCEENNRKSTGFFWNVTGSGLVACQSAILLFFCARYYDQETAGIVSISYAVAMLIYTMARYGVRNYQVTDNEEKYSFSDYFYARWAAVVCAFIVMAVYLLCMVLFNEYTFNKTVIIVEITVLRTINSVEDVYLGRFQQKGNFAVGARIMAVREFVTLAAVCALICSGMEITLVLLLGIISGIVIDILMIKKSYDFLEPDEAGFRGFRVGRVKDLLVECFPLCLGTVLAIYASNIPKYVTDWYLDEISQAIIGYLILPVFTIALFNQFLYTPFVKDLGDLWNIGEYGGFIRKILKQSFVIIISAGIVMALSYYVGIPLLSIVYDIELRPYIKEFVLLLIGGGLYALEYYLTIPVTIMHENKKIAISYVSAIFISFLLQKRLVSDHGLQGVSILYCVVNLVITLVLVCSICFRYMSRTKISNNGF